MTARDPRAAAAARDLFAALLADATDASGQVDLRWLLHRSTIEQDAALDLGWQGYADELLQLTAAAQTRIELGLL